MSARRTPQEVDSAARVRGVVLILCPLYSQPAVRYVKFGLKWGAGLMLDAFLEEVAKPSPFATRGVVVCCVKCALVR